MADNNSVVEYLPSTDDNPWNPFTHFDEWYAHDTKYGHNSLCIMARLAHQSPGLTDEENRQEAEQAIDTMVNKLVSSNGDRLVHYIKVSNLIKASGA
ncbi:MAG: hypothetical protein J6Y02_11690 [Pseudobutyrivibrio sp.]|nr:hypothetical protein [Pseudobutyrivibrio sp.]